jgi:hypothetical protein
MRKYKGFIAVTQDKEYLMFQGGKNKIYALLSNGVIQRAVWKFEIPDGMVDAYEVLCGMMSSDGIRALMQEHAADRFIRLCELLNRVE